MRFALSPDGVVTPDLGAKLPGRGAWTLARRDAVEKAAAGGLFARAFRAPASLSDGVSAAAFAEKVAQGLADRTLAALGLARRAGAVVTGFDQTRTALKEGGAAALLCAADAAADGVEKLSRLARERPIVRAFDSAAQSQALGRDGVVHAALLAGAPAERFLREARRLSGFRPVFDESAGAEAAGRRWTGAV